MAYRSINPFTEELVKDYPLHTPQQVDRALAAAHAVFRSAWSRGPIQPRLAVLARLAELLVERATDIAIVMATEMGRPIAHGRGEPKLCASIADYYAKHAADMLKPVRYPSSAGEAWVEHHPIGVLLAVEPWNFPFYQVIRVVVPAIAVGNPVLLKHAGNVPGSAALLESLIREAGAPAGAFTNLYISSEQVSDLLGDDRIQGVALTGSETAGAAVASRASAMLKKSTLELGGSDVFAVLDDADIEKAARAGALARVLNAGQACTAAKRFILHDKIADRFVAAFIEELNGFRLGDPLDERTTLGPLSSKGAVDELTRQVNAAVDHGATLRLGGKPVNRKGYFFEPTILTNITRDNPAFYQEFFGPVAQVYVVRDDDELVALANDSHFGLGGAIFTSDIARGRSLASRIETGMVFINARTGTLPELPFGGVKRSGFGRELGDLGIMEFVNKKLVVVSA